MCRIFVDRNARFNARSFVSRSSNRLKHETRLIDRFKPLIFVIDAPYFFSMKGWDFTPVLGKEMTDANRTPTRGMSRWMDRNEKEEF